MNLVTSLVIWLLCWKHPSLFLRGLDNNEFDDSNIRGNCGKRTYLVYQQMVGLLIVDGLCNDSWFVWTAGRLDVVRLR